jgi:hypothetical protein
MALEIENEITHATEHAVRAEREIMFKLICAYCAEGDIPRRLQGRYVLEFAWWHWPEDSKDRKQCEAARLREWMQLPSHASQLLAARISRISERTFGQAWMSDIEFNLWTVLKDQNSTNLPGIKRYYGFEDTTDDELADLKKLAEQANGWVYWDVYDRAFKFVSFPDWEKVHAAQFDRYQSIPEKFEQIIQSVPQEELEQFRPDSSEQHDRYTSGSSRRE